MSDILPDFVPDSSRRMHILPPLPRNRSTFDRPTAPFRRCTTPAKGARFDTFRLFSHYPADERRFCAFRLRWQLSKNSMKKAAPRAVKRLAARFSTSAGFLKTLVYRFPVATRMIHRLVPAGIDSAKSRFGSGSHNHSLPWVIEGDWQGAVFCGCRHPILSQAIQGCRAPMVAVSHPRSALEEPSKA